MEATPPSATAAALLDLDEDSLTAVLLALPEPRQREWIFVALVCRVLHTVTLRAAAADWEREQCARGMPCVPAVFPTGRRLSTALSGIMLSPLRIVYTKERLGPDVSSPGLPPSLCLCGGVLHGFFDAPVPPRAREAFLSAVEYHPADRQSYERAESLAAYHLSTRALYHMVHLAPIATLRGAFYEVLGGGPRCRLDLTLRHHRCLVFFAAMHGRVDVLEWLIHRNPRRATAYDYEAGLLQLLWNFDDAVHQSRLANNAPGARAFNHSACHRVTETQLLLARPAALHNQVAVLRWLSHTTTAMQARSGVAHSISGRRGEWGRATVEFGGLAVSMRASGVGTDGERVYESSPMAFARERTTLVWRSLRLLICEAAAGASLDVLDALWVRVRSSTERPPPVLLNSDPSGKAQAMAGQFGESFALRASLTWALVLTVLLKPRRGAVLRWVVDKCVEERGELHRLALLFPPWGAGHVWNDTVFDMEDVLFAGLHTDTWTNRYVMGAFDLLSEETLLRERIASPGDADKTEWLLDELTRAEELMAEQPPFLVDGHAIGNEPNDGAARPLRPDCTVLCPATRRGWLARSLAGYVARNGEMRSGDLFLRTEIDPELWSRTDSLCRHLMRAAFFSTGVHSAGPPLLLELPWAASSSFSRSRVNDEELPESFVFASPTTLCEPWMSTEGLAGATLLQRGMAVVLRRWLLLVLRTTYPGGTEAAMRERCGDWSRALRETPEACYTALSEVCDAMLVEEQQDECEEDAQKRIETASRVLGELIANEVRDLTAAVLHPCSGLSEGRPMPMETARGARARWRATWACAYCALATKWGLFDAKVTMEILSRTRTTAPELHVALRNALATKRAPNDTTTDTDTDTD